MKKIFFLSVFFLLAGTSICISQIFKIDSIHFKAGLYNEISELRDSTSSIELSEFEFSLDDSGASNFVFNDITLNDDLELQRLYFYLEKNQLFNVTASNLTVNGVFDLSGYKLGLNLTKAVINVLDLQSSVIENVVLIDCVIDTLILNRSEIKNFIIHSGLVRNIYLKECHNISSFIIDDHVEIEEIAMPDFRPPTDGNVFIRIGCNSLRKNYSFARLLADSKTDFERINLDYRNFNLQYMDDGNKGTPDEIRSLYHRLLRNLEEKGQSDNYLRLLRQKKKFEASIGNPQSVFDVVKNGVDFFFSYTLPDWWWGFGYEKKNVLWNTLLLFGVSLLVGSIFFSKIIKEYPPVFEDGALKDNYNNGKKLARFFYSIIGIAILFFGVEFKVSQLKFTSWVTSSLIIAIYLIGLICLGFIANLILTF